MVINFKQWVESAQLPTMDELIKQKHFDAKPTIMSEEELQKAIQGGALEMWRAVKNPQFAQEFKYGRYFTGTTQNPMYKATGIYFAYGPEGKKYAQEFYSNGNGAVIHAALKPGTKIIDSEQLSEQISEFKDQEHNFLRGETSKMRYGQFDRIKERELEKRRQWGIGISNDIGEACVYLGYEGVDIKFASHMLMLNRGAILVGE